MCPIVSVWAPLCLYELHCVCMCSIVSVWASFFSILNVWALLCVDDIHWNYLRWDQFDKISTNLCSSVVEWAKLWPNELFCARIRRIRFGVSFDFLLLLREQTNLSWYPMIKLSPSLSGNPTSKTTLPFFPPPPSLSPIPHLCLQQMHCFSTQTRFCSPKQCSALIFLLLFSVSFLLSFLACCHNMVMSSNFWPH